MNSATVNVVTKRGNPRLGFPGAFSALVFLFDTDSTELIAVLQDYFINEIRDTAFLLEPEQGQGGPTGRWNAASPPFPGPEPR